MLPSGPKTPHCSAVLHSCTTLRHEGGIDRAPKVVCSITLASAGVNRTLSRLGT